MRIAHKAAMAVMLGWSIAGTAGAEEGSRMRLAQDTPVELRLTHSLSSADAVVNDTVEFEVTEDVRADGAIAIRKGSPAWGVITAASPRARVARPGKLEVEIQAVCLADGASAPLRARREDGRAGTQSFGGEDPGEIVFALPALPVLLFMYGKDVTIPKGRELTVFVAEDVAFASRPAGGVPQAACAPAHFAHDANGAELARLRISSDPNGAEVTVDGRYAGNAPSVLRLAAGEHRVTISLPGRKDWDRVIVITPGGETNIVATLEASHPRPVALVKEGDHAERTAK